jgi:hypothetical protein
MANEFNIKNGFISANDSVVNGKLTTQNLRIISGATSGYVLTSDASGNAIWQPTSGSFTGGTVTGSTIFTNGLTANTISATTYLNLPIDAYVTTGITANTQTLSTGYTYYGIVHSTNVDLTLPNPTGIDGFNLNVKDESGNSGIYRIRITTPIGTIDGGSYVDMNINYMSLQFVARNNNWWII